MASQRLLNDLPHEVLSLIARHLSFGELSRLGQTCQLWRKLASSDAVWHAMRHLDLTTARSPTGCTIVPSAAVVLATLSRCRAVTSVTTPVLTDTLVEGLVTACPAVTRLIVDCSADPTASLGFTTEGFSRLASAYGQLQTLHLLGFRSLEPVGVARALFLCPVLEHLTIGDQRPLLIHMHEEPPPPPLPLKTLTVSNSTVAHEEQTLRDLTDSYPHLEALTMECVENLATISPASLSLDSLEKLVLYNCSVESIDVTGLPCLTRLQLSYNLRLRAVVAECPNLQVVTLIGCSALETVTLFSPTLAELDVANCSSLEYLSLDCHSLQVLNINGAVVVLAGAASANCNATRCLHCASVIV